MIHKKKALQRKGGGRGKGRKKNAEKRDNKGRKEMSFSTPIKKENVG